MVKIDFVNAQEPAINDTNLNQMQLNIENAINAQVSGDTLPVGCIVPFTSDTVPENWLLCDGSAVSRTDYTLLFSIIGTSYGVGDGSTTFNLPNLKGKVAVGKDSTQTEFDVLGEAGGEKTHTLTVQEMPSHDHTNEHYVVGTNARGYSTWEENIASGSGASYKATASTNLQGGGQAHNNLQPYQVTNYIIKAKQSAGVVATVVDNLNSTSQTDALSAKQGKILDEKIEAIIDIIYPVGSIYISTNNTSPSILFGGTWEQIHGRFLLASGTPSANSDLYFGDVSGVQWIAVAGSTGGEDYHTLTQNEMPSHSHTSKGWAGVVDGSGSYITLGGAGGDTTYNTNYTGGSQSHNNMPPYLAVNMWKRIV